MITDFTIDKDENGKTTGYTGRRKSIPKSIIEKIEPLYKTLLDIENLKGEKASELYFEGYLNEEIGKSYDEFVLDLFVEESLNQKDEGSKFKKGLNWFFFGDTNPQ